MFNFKAKVDDIGMYHSIAKDLDEYNGGSHLMRDIGFFMQRKPKKYTVIFLSSSHTYYS